MTDLAKLAKDGAALIEKLEAKEDPAIRAQLDKIVSAIESGWTLVDCEIETWPRAKIEAATRGQLSDDLIRLAIRDTGGHVSVHPGFGHKLVDFYHRKGTGA